MGIQRRGAIALLLVICAFRSSTANAQSADVSSTIDSVEFRTGPITPLRRPLSREDYDSEGLLVLASRGASEPFALMFDIPSTLATNPTKRGVGSRDAAHFTPTGTLSYSGAGEGYSYGIAFFAIGDEFVGGTASDTSFLGSKLGGMLRDRTQKLAVLASYSPKRIFADTFGAGTVTIHDLSIGVGRTLDVGGGNALTIDVSYIRREASKAGFQQHQPTLAVAAGGSLIGRSKWLVKQQVQRRIYSDAVSLDRRDWNFSSQAEVSYPLDRLLILKLVAILERNSSNTEVKSYTAFDIGPKISLAYPF